MTGKAKYAERMAKHLNEPIEAACPITRPGGTASLIRGTLGNVAGAHLRDRRASDIAVGQFAWLGVGPAHFAITKASLMGRPTGDPLALIACADVADVAVTEAMLTLQVDLDLNDGRRIAFEAKRHGQNRPNVEVLELLRERCARV